MKVSVIIPAYNEEKFIGNCLESLKNQLEKPDEILVVNNNSTDNTAEIARKYASIGVKVIDEKQRGIAAARNAGYDAAQGDILARCDSDTIVPRNWIQRIKEDFTQEAIDGLSGPIYFYDIPLFSKSTFLMDKLHFQSLKKKFNGSDVLFGANMVITKKTWEVVKGDVCGDEKDIHEDIDLTIHMILKGLKIYFDETLAVGASARRFFQHPQSFFSEYPKKTARSIAEYTRYQDSIDQR